MTRKKALIISLVILIIGFSSYFLYMDYMFNREIDIPVLMYHHLSTNKEDLNSATIKPDKFRLDMKDLKDAGYNTILPEDIIKYNKKEKTLPKKPILVTFDDGYRSNYEYAYPILKELNMKAVISVIGWSVGRDKHMDDITPINAHFTWEEGKEMFDSGLIDIQAHSFDLHDPEGLSYGQGKPSGLGVDFIDGENKNDYRERLINDTNKIKDLIENNIGNKVILYAYPYGVYNDISEKVLKDMGFKITLTTENGVYSTKEGSFLLPRINVDSQTDIIEVLESIEK